jgi:uncharacterized membrane protein|tara:strand:+ start:48 stop:239 length:192 start_codon:yes stop_codon:yes gene_type:complete
MLVILPIILVVGGIAVMVFMWLLRSGNVHQHHTLDMESDSTDRLSTAANEPAEGDGDSKQDVA